MRIAVIPARGGSRRIPRKNIRDFMGKPIIAYSIETAKAAGADAVYVSTDDDEIRDVAWRYGAKLIERPPALAADDVGTQEVMKHAVDVLQLDPADSAACIYATAPLITPQHLVEAAWVHYARGYFVVSVGTEPLCDAGAFYIGTAHAFRRLPLWNIHTSVYPLPPERVCDINTLDDFSRAERMYAALNTEIA